MEIADLLIDLRKRGVLVSAEDGDLIIRAKQGALHESLRETLREQKARILNYLAPGDVVMPQLKPAPQEAHEPFGLTPMQQAYWIGRRSGFDLGGQACQVYLEYESTDLNLNRLEDAWNGVLKRHDMMRAEVLPNGMQRILPERMYHFPVHDFRQFSPQRLHARLETLRGEISRRLTPMEQRPLFEIQIALLPNQKVRLHFRIELMMADAFSVFLLLREWSLFYKDPDTVLPRLGLSFRDYQAARLRFESSATYKKAAEYWSHRELPPGPPLPRAVRTSEGAPRFRRWRDVLPAAQWNKLKTGAKEIGVTVSTVLCSAFADILALWSGRDRFSLNLTSFNRDPIHPDVQSLVGEFTSTILLECDLRAPDFASRARRVATQLATDLEHAAYSGVDVLREQNRRRRNLSEAGAPVVFTSMIAFQNDEVSPTAWLGEETFSISQTPQVLLDHQVMVVNGDLVWTWDFVDNAFPAGLVEEMGATYRRYLARLAEAPAAWQVGGKPLLKENALAPRLAANTTKLEIAEYSLDGPFRKRVRQSPQAQAVIDGSMQLSYAELDSRARSLAHRLIQKGMGPGDAVAIVMHKGWEQVVAVLGVLYVGAAYVPVDGGLPQERVEWLLAHSEARVLVTTSEVLAKQEALKNRAIVIGTNDSLNEAPLPHLPEDPQRLAYIIYTSGSTGRPKGVMIDHGGAINTICDINSRFHIHASDRVLAVSSLSFDLSVWDIFGVLAAGGTIVMPPASAHPDPDAWARLVEDARITVWNTVPALVDMLVTVGEGRKSRCLNSLRLVMMSGDWIPLGLPARITAVTECPQVISLGGATEGSIWSILFPIQNVLNHWRSIPYGKPMGNQRFYVLDRHLQHCPTWVAGDLYIGGRGVALGYWREPTKTAKAFIPHPDTGERLYRTGDLGCYLPDGHIEFLGRNDFQVKVGGFRVELGEIETALLQAPDIREVVVSTLGQRFDNKKLVAYVVPVETVEDVDAFTATLTARLTRQLPHYMVPKIVHVLEQLPLNDNGKVDRRALGQLAIADKEAVVEATAPRTQLEKELAVIWTRRLGLDDLDVHANFFELGGDSLSATRLIMDVRGEYDLDLPLNVLFEAPTLAEFAQKVQIPKTPVATIADVEEGCL